MAEPAAKKLKGAGSYDCAYKEQLADTYPVGPVNGSKGAFYCIPCKKSVSCTHQGLGDVKQHCADKTHRKNAAAITQSRKITFTRPVSADKQICAEVLNTSSIVQHNISFLTADHLAPLYRVMFPDSNIAKNFRCRRTKTTCMLNNALYPKIKSNLIEYMSENPYALANDGSSDCGPSNMNPVCVYIFDVKRSKQVEFKFYSMCSTSGEDCSKAETLFTAINDAFKSDDFYWDNVVSVGLDNTDTNMKSRNSLRTRILAENPQTFIAGCKCHLAHLAAGKGDEAHVSITKFDCEDHQVDLYNFLKRSTRRKVILQEYMDFAGCECENFTRFVSPKWLSIVSAQYYSLISKK